MCRRSQQAELGCQKTQHLFLYKSKLPVGSVQAVAQQSDAVADVGGDAEHERNARRAVVLEN